jgi:O-antigen/teichoic acid export membrane protein
MREPDKPREDAPQGGPGKTLTRRTFESFLWTISGAIGQALLRIAVLALLARLLTPADFGVVGAALTVVALAEIFGQIGVAPAIIQSSKLNDTDIRTGFTISLTFGFLIAALMFSSAGLVAGLFRMPAVEPIVQAFSVIFLVRGSSVVSEALLVRDLKFRTISMILLASYAVSYGGVAPILALRGHGAWALVWAQICQSVVLSICYIWFSRHSFVPCLNRHALFKLGRFGTGETMSRFGNYVALNADQFVVGRLIGAEALGIYSRAYLIMMQPVNLFGSIGDKVLFPALASIQTDETRLVRAYFRAISMIALTTLPLTGILFVMAPELVQVVLGPQWSALVLPLQILVLPLFFRTAYKISATLMRARGAIYWLAAWQWLYALAVTIGAYAGHFYGLTGACAGVSIVVFTNFWVGLLFARKACSVQMRPILTILLGYGLLATAVTVPLFVLKWQIVHRHSFSAEAAGWSAAALMLSVLLSWFSVSRLLSEDRLWIRGVLSREARSRSAAT